jgi:threonine dehydratase
MQNKPSMADIREAALRIQAYIHKTPILTSQSINHLVGAKLFFKCENFQKTGSFKMRGAANTVFSLTEDEIKNGVATQSSGNHGQAVALSANLRNVPAYIVMPDNSAKVKIESVKAYQGNIIHCASTIEAREASVAKILAETKANYIHPYNDLRVITGQATVSLELLEELTQNGIELDFILSPIGGGGLMSGTALTTHYLSPKTTVVGAEPKEADDAFRSFYSGIMQANTTTNTIADGLRASIRENTFAIIKNHVQQIVTVEETEIIAAMKLIWNRLKILIEPSCAVPFAAILFGKVENIAGKNIGIILTGGNVDIDSLPF